MNCDQSMKNYQQYKLVFNNVIALGLWNVLFVLLMEQNAYINAFSKLFINTIILLCDIKFSIYMLTLLFVFNRSFK